MGDDALRGFDSRLDLEKSCVLNFLVVSAVEVQRSLVWIRRYTE